MTRRMDRRQYAQMYGPTTGDRVRLGDTALVARGRARPHGVRRRVQVRRRQGPARRHGPGGRRAGDDEALDLVITNALVVDWTGIYKADVGIKRGRIVGIGKAGNPDVMAGVTPGMVVGVTTEVHRRRGAHPHRGRHRHAHPLHLPAAGVRGDRERRDDVRRRRHRPGDRHERDDVHAGRAARRAHAAGDRRAPGQHRAHRQGQLVAPEGLVEQIRAGRGRPQAPRGLGHDAGGDRLLPADRRASTTCRSRSTPTRSTSPATSTTRSRRSRGARSTPIHTEGAGGGHAPDIIRVCGEPNVLPSSTNPTRPVHGQHARRAPRHAHGLPPPRSVAPGGRRLRREPDPRRDDRGRGHPARPRRDQHDSSSTARRWGASARSITRTWQTADKMRRQRGRLAGGARRQRQPPHPALRREVHDQPRDRARHGATRSARSRSGKLADLVLWRPAFFGAKPELVLKGGLHRLGADGRPERLDPDAAAGPHAADVRRARPRGRRDERRVRLARRARGGRGRTRYGLAKRLVAVRGCRRPRQEGHEAQRRAAADRGRSGDVRGARRRRAPALRAGRATPARAAVLPVLMTAPGSPFSSPTPRSPPAASRTPAGSRRRVQLGRCRGAAGLDRVRRGGALAGRLARAPVRRRRAARRRSGSPSSTPAATPPRRDTSRTARAARRGGRCSGPRPRSGPPPGRWRTRFGAPASRGTSPPSRARSSRGSARAEDEAARLHLFLVARGDRLRGRAARARRSARGAGGPGPRRRASRRRSSPRRPVGPPRTPPRPRRSSISSRPTRTASTRGCSRADA